MNPERIEAGGWVLARLRLRYSLRGFSGDPAAHEVARVVALVLVERVLVGFLRAPERGRWHDLGDDRLLEVVLRLLLRPEGLLFLLGVVREDDRAVLVPVVGALAVHRRRIVHVPERVQQLRVRDLGRVVSDLDGLGVAGPARADLLVRPVVNRAAVITRAGLHTALRP